MNYSVQAVDNVMEIKDESSDASLANDQYSLTGNQYIVDHQPPTHNEYNDSVDDDEAGIQ
jgi:hypothetical protein